MQRLTIVTSDRPARLAERLAADLGAAPLSPFALDTIVVQSQGMARWLRHELARRHGCAAGLDLPFPAGFCHRLAATIDGNGQDTIDERFDREALTWRILELFEQGLAEEPGFEPLHAYAAKPDTRKRLGLAARLAGRFDDYQLYRPDVLLSWENEEPTEASAHERWQAALWRRLCANGNPRHLARWFTEAIARLETATEPPAGLPPRVAVFGVSTLPPLFVRLLRAVARFVPVTVYVGAPRRATWQSAEPNAGNPLFAGFGHAIRDLLALLTDAEWVELDDSSGAEPRTLLHRLQHDVRAGIHRGGEPHLATPVTLDAADDSLLVHVCHSPLREMEVLRDQLFAAFAADATLRPHDVLVLVPDVAAYAPFVEAVFDAQEEGLPRIPHHVADRPIVQESSLADATLRILRLVGARCTAAELVELLELPAVRRAAGLPDAATGRILQWIADTRIRWGRDGATRKESFDLPAVDANTWRAGLDRLLMGYAVGPVDGMAADVLPHAGDTIGDPHVLGAFARWVDRLFDLLADWRTPRAMTAWAATLHDTVADFLHAGDDAEERELGEVLGAIDRLARVETIAGCTRAIDVSVVRDWLEHELSGDGFGSGFLVGGMTVCATKPMRSIPFRVVAMCGLDDASFPRRDRRAAYDLMEIAPRAGDRNLRADDRQLFLDTLLAAADRLILSYVGRSARTNEPRAASVVVAELLDVVDRSFTCAGVDESGRPIRARDAIVVEHRLQPFSPAYYDGTSPRLFSYSRANARATASLSRASRATATRREAAPWLAGPVATSAVRPRTIALEDLVACWSNTSRFFCERALDVRLPGDEEPLDDCEPMHVDGLARYGVHDEILRRHLSGERRRDDERKAAVAQGRLPSGALAPLWFDRIDAELQDFLARVGRPEFEEPLPVEVKGATWTIVGRVDGLTGDGRLQVRPAKRKAKDVIRAWITHVAMSAAWGDSRSTLVALDGSVLFGAVDDPIGVLDDLVAGHDACLVAPVPFFERASHAYADRSLRPSTRAKTSPLDVARTRWLGSDFGDGAPGDAADAYHALCWRGRDPMADEASLARWSEGFWRPAFAAMTESKA